jgi:hypothetical protein
MAKTAAKKPSSSNVAPFPNGATPPASSEGGPTVTAVEEIYTSSIRLTLSNGEHVDLIASGAGSFEANKQQRALALAALRNTLKS